MAYNNREYQYIHSAGAGTTVAFVGRGTLGGVYINTATAIGAITITDAVSYAALSSGTTVAIIASGSPAGVYVPNLVISQGLVVEKNGAADITIAFAKG